MNIKVNGVNYSVVSDDLSTEGKLGYHRIVMMSGRGTFHNNPSVTYSTHRPNTDEQRAGNLLPGASVEIEEGMIFNVANTGNA